MTPETLRIQVGDAVSEGSARTLEIKARTLVALGVLELLGKAGAYVDELTALAKIQRHKG